MGKLRSFLRFFVYLGVAFFANAAFAGGYTCLANRQYTGCAQNYYMVPNSDGKLLGTGNSCKTCPSGSGWQSTTTAGNTSAGCECPTNYWNSTTHGSTVVSGQTCSIKSVTCAAGTYLEMGKTSCTQCPKKSYCPGGKYDVSTVDQGISSCPTLYYPNSDEGSSAITDCYSNTKFRRWQGEWANCIAPANCSSATCKKTIPAICEYVAYSNELGTADGKLKSGCATNNETQTPVVSSVTASAGSYVSGTSCLACPDGYTSEAGNTGNVNAACYKTCTRKCDIQSSDCPAFGLCRWVPASTNGRQYYNGTCNAPQSYCAFSLTGCETGYEIVGTKCEPITVTITYNPGAGARSNTAESNRRQNVTYGQLFTPRNVSKSDLDFIKPGFKFDKWSGSYPYPTRSYTYDKDTPIEVEAQWTACPYNNSFSGKGQCDCGADQFPDGNGCTECTVSCSLVNARYPLGKYNTCNGEEADSKCYRNCTTNDIQYSVTVTGVEYLNGDYMCEPTQCKIGYYIYSGMCEKCPTNAYCDGSKDYVCNNGYTLNNGQCVANKYTVTFDANGGTLDFAAKITVTYNSKLSALASAYIPTHTDPTQHFSGYYDAKTGGTQYYDKSGNPTKAVWDKASSATLYARWGQTLVYCENVGAGKYYDGGAAQICPGGYYCPGEGDAYEGAEGCKIECSTLGSEYTHSDAGAKSPSDCYKVSERTCRNPGANKECPEYATKCRYLTDTMVSCNQHYNSDTCEYSDGLGTCPRDHEKTSCNTDRYNDMNGSCPLCAGLEPAGTWDQSYGGQGGATICYQACSFDCATYVNTYLTPAGATCSALSDTINGGRYYPGMTCEPRRGLSCSAVNCTCGTGYSFRLPSGADGDIGSCDPNTYIITLNDGDGTGGNGTIYEKYATGWFSDSGTTNAIAKATVPTRDGWTFLGYYTEQSGGSKVISESGALPASTTFTANATLHAHWSQNAFNCQAGKYYNGSEFVTCPAGMYCDGSGTVPVNNQGCVELCPNGGASSDGATMATECFVACPTPATIKNGTLSNTQARQNWNGTEYPACTFTATCDSGYVAKDSPGTNPTCVWADSDLCPTGFYCPEGEDPQACPDDGISYSADKDNQARSITDCYKIFDPYDGFKNGVAAAKCYYSVTYEGYTNCGIHQLYSCDAGYYYKTDGAFVCEGTSNGYYSPADDTNQTKCPLVLTGGSAGSTPNAKSYTDCYKTCQLTVENSDSVAAAANTVNATSEAEYATCSFNVTCKTGYTVANNNTEKPTCNANNYTITLDKNGGAGSVAASVQCTFDSGTCRLPATTALTRTGYSVDTKWCTTANGGAPCYDGGTIVTANISETGEDTKLYAVWNANTYTISLDDRGAQTAAAPRTVYLKYATGWYSNADATATVTTLTTTPVKAGYTFSGYYNTETAGSGVQVIDAAGIFITSPSALTAMADDATIYARWTAGKTTCPAGTYYTGFSTTCAPCEENFYCPGGEFGVDGGSIAGRHECPDSGLSPANSSEVAACYKAGLTYAADNGSGTQRCFYDTSARTYSAKCDTIQITACNAGYWLESNSDTDCTAVGEGYYSANTFLTRDQCPNDGTTETDTAVKVQECYKESVDYTATNGSGTQRCFYSDGTGSAAVYARDCDSQEITACNGGYWLADSSDIDCVEVGLNNYSEPGDVKLHNCPANGQTIRTTSEDIKLCFKGDQEYTGEHGHGVRVCFYSSGTGDDAIYSDSCEKPKMTYCDAGYYSNDKQNAYDCIPAGYGYYSAAGNVDHTECPNYGQTDTPLSEAITACFVTYNPYDGFMHGEAEVRCDWKTETSAYDRCGVMSVISCDAGYWYQTPQSFTCEGTSSGEYSPAGSTTATDCPSVTTGGVAHSTEHAAKYSDCYKQCIKTVEHASTVAAKDNTVKAISATAYAACSFNVVCETGYTVADNNTENPTCNANTYTITLDKNGGTGTLDSSVQCTFDSGECELPVASSLTKPGYSAESKWCATANGGAPCYAAGENITENLSPTGTDMTLYLVWTPRVFTVTLDSQGAQTAAQPKTVYLKYATRWASDSAAANMITTLTTLPVKAGYNFTGFYTATTDGVQVIDSNGTFITSTESLTAVTQNATIYARWSAGTTKCAEGQYYTGRDTTCAPCESNYYCPGGTFGVDSGNITGRHECPESGKAPAGASNIAQCYKELLPYTATYGTGTQTCYYDESESSYSIACGDWKMLKCNAGYWLQSDSADDCVAAGFGYYSPADVLTHTACPNAGQTEVNNATKVQDCYKTELPYTATYGSGTQRCFYSDGDGDAAVYARDCDTKLIDKCRGGYYRAQPSDTDCVEVGLNYYSITDYVTRSACPAGGETRSATSDSINSCFKSGMPYSAEHGTGVHVCFWSSGHDENALYSRSCETPTMTYCDAGYYSLPSANPNDCIVVGKNYYSIIGDTTRTACAPDGVTDSETSGLASDCYMAGMSCAIENGTGTQTCHYNETDNAYSYNCTTCAVTACDAGFSLVGNACTKCPADSVCADGEQKTCSDLTGGEFPKADAGTTNKDMCYKDCALATNATAMTGRDYYGIADTCAISQCMAGYSLEDGVCVKCADGNYCQEDQPAQSCASLGDGSWKYSDSGATSSSQCYRKCEPYAIVGGTAIPVNETEYWPKDCEYKGRSDNGNECEIVDGVCVETACRGDYEMIDNHCEPCNRDHALEYDMNNGNCNVKSCEIGYHPYGQSCEQDVRECSAPNAISAQQRWDKTKKAFGACTVMECESGFHIAANACVSDVQPCTVDNGTGTKEWNHDTNAWNACIATSCNPGYTNDPSETNDANVECGRCANMFGVGGERAASSYVRGCEIASCMYQGEIYNLEDNECKPICTEDSDDTGSRRRVGNKCVSTCNAGYTAW